MGKKDSKKRNRNVRMAQKRASNKKRRASVKAEKTSADEKYSTRLDKRLQVSNFQRNSVLPYIRIRRPTNRPKLPVVLKGMEDNTSSPPPKIERTK